MSTYSTVPATVKQDPTERLDTLIARLDAAMTAMLEDAAVAGLAFKCNYCGDYKIGSASIHVMGKPQCAACYEEARQAEIEDEEVA